MRGSRIWVATFAAAALSFLWTACSSTTATSCAFGAEGCACTAGGACDPGLSCISAVCVKIDAGPTTTHGSTGGTMNAGGAATAGAAGMSGGRGGAGGALSTGGSGGAGGASGGAAGASAGAGGVNASGSGGGGATGGRGGAGGSAGASAGGAGTSGGRGGSGGMGGASAGSAGTGGSAGSDSGVPGTVTLGGACQKTGDCAAGLNCIRPTDNLSSNPAASGGVGNGICTADCTTTGSCGASGICLAIDEDVDAGVISKALCFESCTIGPNPPSPPVAKCHSRKDVACQPVNQAETLFACIPICLTDADCGTRKCEVGSGLCVDIPRTGKTVGSACTAGAGAFSGECAGGLCLPIEASSGGSTPGVCSSFCRLNTLEACNFRNTPIDAGPPMGACVFPWRDTGYNTGDLGLCLQLCDTENDCSYKASNWTCRTEVILSGFGHSVCLVPEDG